MADPTFPVDPPARTPRRGGIRTVAEFRTNDRIGLGGNVVYTSADCSMTVGAVALCYPTGQVQTPKTGGGIATKDAVVDPFGGYYGVTCWLEGEDYESLARKGLEDSEDRHLEKALNVWLQAVAATATVASFTEAIAQAEALADKTYIGAPVLVMNRGDVVRAVAEDALSGDKEGNLWTPNGTLVIASGEVAANSVSIIGALTVEQTNIVVTRVRDLELNTELAIAERAYAFLVDCNIAARFVVDTTP